MGMSGLSPGVRCRNNGLAPGDARSSHALVLAICLVFVRGTESRPPHAGPVSKLFLQSRRVALNPFPQPEQSGPGGARSCVANHSWSWPLLMCPFAAHRINAGRPLIDPMRHVAWLALRAPSTPSWLIRWPFGAHSVGNGPRPPSLRRLRRPPSAEDRHRAAGRLVAAALPWSRQPWGCVDTRRLASWTGPFQGGNAQCQPSSWPSSTRTTRSQC
jgi:hypothetical protein